MTACFLLKSSKLLFYFPVLAVVGMVTGTVIGLISNIIIGRIKRYDRFFEG